MRVSSYHEAVRTCIARLHVLPAPAVADVLPAEAHALVVVRVERQDPLEHLLRPCNLAVLRLNGIRVRATDDG